ncbi:hypothetical protein F5Y15DRAFT_260857 [Xylariaceae sp. FL0016]|nr:hypothetical protein F5Y15DRAFT_260857 [Xylariaceae sp. FL0016]
MWQRSSWLLRREVRERVMLDTASVLSGRTSGSLPCLRGFVKRLYRTYRARGAAGFRPSFQDSVQDPLGTFRAVPLTTTTIYLTQASRSPVFLGWGSCVWLCCLRLTAAHHLRLVRRGRAGMPKRPIGPVGFLEVLQGPLESKACIVHKGLRMARVMVRRRCRRPRYLKLCYLGSWELRIPWRGGIGVAACRPLMEIKRHRTRAELSRLWFSNDVKGSDVWLVCGCL